MAQGGIWLSIEEANQLGYDLQCLWYQMHPDQTYGPWTERQRKQVDNYSTFFCGDSQSGISVGDENLWPKSSMEAQRIGAEPSTK